MEVSIPDGVIRSAVTKALTAQDGYGRRSALEEIAKACLAAQAPEIERAVAECVRDTVTSQEFRIVVASAIREGVVEAARTEALKLGKRKAQVAVAAGEMFAAQSEPAK